MSSFDLGILILGVCPLIVLGLLILWATYAKNMFELGIILIVAGLCFGWPFAVIGAGLVVIHFYKNKSS